MSILQFIIHNWYFFLIGIAAAVTIYHYIHIFLSTPSENQIQKVKEWLLYAVTVAEKELGGGTGKIKLRYVYDMFIKQFPFLVEKITFEFFSFLVDEVLVQFRSMLLENKQLQDYVQP